MTVRVKEPLSLIHTERNWNRKWKFRFLWSCSLSPALSFGLNEPHVSSLWTVCTRCTVRHVTCHTRSMSGTPFDCGRLSSAHTGYLSSQCNFNPSKSIRNHGYQSIKPRLFSISNKIMRITSANSCLPLLEGRYASFTLTFFKCDYFNWKVMTRK